MATLDINIRQANSDFQAIKTALNIVGAGIEEGTKTSEYAEKVIEVYEAGKKTEHEAKWNAIHDSIEAYGCHNAFSGASWTKETFRPIRNINVYSSYMMFRHSRIAVDLPKLLEELGVQITFQALSAMQYTFYGTQFTRLGVFDFSDCYYSNGCFSDSDKLVTIDKIICNKNTKFTDAFDWLYSLENIIFEGELAKDGLNLQDSTSLSKESILSIINVLSTTTTGLTVTLSLDAVNKAFETSAGANDGEKSPEWNDLVADRNWNISLL